MGCRPQALLLSGGSAANWVVKDDPPAQLSTKYGINEMQVVGQGHLLTLYKAQMQKSERANRPPEGRGAGGRRSRDSPGVPQAAAEMNPPLQASSTRAKLPNQNTSPCTAQQLSRGHHGPAIPRSP